MAQEKDKKKKNNFIFNLHDFCGLCDIRVSACSEAMDDSVDCNNCIISRAVQGSSKV